MGINYHALFYLMATHQYIYMDGIIEGIIAADNATKFNFATGVNGWGDRVEVDVYNKDCTFEVFKRNKQPVKFKHVPFDKLITTMQKAITE